MRDFPRLRYLAFLAFVALGVVLFGSDFDWAAALDDLGVKATALASALLAIAKILEEARRSLEDTKPVAQANGYHIVGGRPDLAPFWRRVI